MSLRSSLVIGLGLLILSNGSPSSAEVVSPARLASSFAPFLECLRGMDDSFRLQADLELPIDGRSHSGTIVLDRYSGEAFDLEIEHEKYHVRLERRRDETALFLPKHGVVFYGRGPVNPDHRLAPQDLMSRFVSQRTKVAAYVGLLASDSQVLALVVANLLNLSFDPASAAYRGPNDLQLSFSDAESSLTCSGDGFQIAVSLDSEFEHQGIPRGISLGTARAVSVPRDELERVVVRGVRRALEVFQPGPILTSPAQRNRRVSHGELRWIDGHRVALLHGSPEQIGRAHGELLKAESEACIDSVLHGFALVQTIHQGRWFRYELDAAYQRLKPHIPEDHLRETSALADSLGWDEQLVQAVNVFPELFHCSGFAVFDSATVHGKLFHGRVLDYMTTIGLQDAATTFIIDVDGKIPFATVGYAGFIGSVSGMNERAISLGEMGGRGEGQWDGVPMATLMRRALEECSSLDEVRNLWTNSPRTCEYFYVFADGKTNEAVGVAATPDRIEFVEPGQAHPLLGDGIPDAVVLSAGDRLKHLRQRVQDRHGKIDLETARWLMSRPVAMKSNLHNVLFVPEDRELHVANASHDRPAAERPYVRIRLADILAWKRPNDTAARGQTSIRVAP